MCVTNNKGSEDIYKTKLRANIKLLRQLKGLNQENVARELGVAQGTYNNWETGRRVPELDTILKIADYYNVQLDYLFGRNI